MTTRQTIERARARAARMNRARWDAENRRIEAQMPARLAEMELVRVLNEHPSAPGEWIGTLEYRARSGRVRKWVIRRGPRLDQITIDGVEAPKNWTWLFDRLRRRIRHA